jgi:uncharacterized glyoxalase superfamily protein PhnB
MKLDAIGVVVPDMARAVKFYQLLGVEFEDPEPETAHHEATLPNGLRLMLDTVDLVKSFTEWVEPVGNRVGLAFLCDSPAEVDEIYKRVTDAGFEGAKEPWDAFWGQRYAQVKDPGGSTVDLFARLE